jgi:uncharacterized protein YggL (DUF469 family)
MLRATTNRSDSWPRLFAHDDARSWRSDLGASAGAVHAHVAGSRAVFFFDPDVLRTARRSIAMKSNHVKAHCRRVGRVDAGYEVPRTWRRAPMKWTAICAAICSRERGVRGINDLRFVPPPRSGPLPSARGMKKRIRKKKRVREFQELGFDVDAGLRPGMDRDAVHAFGDRLIAQIEARHLAFGGGIGPTVGGFVSRFGRASATEGDRARIIAFLAGDPGVLQHEIRDLRDAWDE